MSHMLIIYMFTTLEHNDYAVSPITVPASNGPTIIVWFYFLLINWQMFTI
jgi:hypothetical protein